MLDFYEVTGILPADQQEEQYKVEVLKDLWICLVSREASITGRKEVLNGKAKFGILGDGKELPQVAMARAFRKGDFRSGYYRDQTLIFALGLGNLEDFFAQLYADSENDPFSGGRQMNNHFATPLIDEDGEWLKHTDRYNSSADISPTAGQMARGLGLALASKQYRIHGELDLDRKFSIQGNEVIFCTIGDASTSEGVFWESLNAAAVARVPMAVSIWDDGFGISVPKDLQTVKANISQALSGFEKQDEGNGIMIYNVAGNDYPGLVATYDEAISLTRKNHWPCLIHVNDLTQPLGHSTSGSHERYKSEERLRYEKEGDGIEHFINWIISNRICEADAIEDLRQKARIYTLEKKNAAWDKVKKQSSQWKQQLTGIVQHLTSEQKEIVFPSQKELETVLNPGLSTIMKYAFRMDWALQNHGYNSMELSDFIKGIKSLSETRFHTHLYSSSAKSALAVDTIPAVYPPDPTILSGHEIINRFFDQKFEQMPALMAFGEDVGRIGGVNQGFAGLQEKYGSDRIFDAGIREWTIMGEAIGLAMRGFRPIAEIQYLDYLIYGISPLSDDLATLRYRSAGQQMAPVIVRTRGHRLEGIWHAGSPMGVLLNTLRGVYVAVPRNMTQAAGFYNTLLKSDDPGIIIESLNGYRLKEKLPENLVDFTLALGVPEVLREGGDLTLVSYGSTLREAGHAIELLERRGISVELIDVQTLLPFDKHHRILESLKKTNKLVILDEDIPGGASAFMLQQILEVQDGWHYLDMKPLTITAREHRTPFGSDGDYFTKPNAESIAEEILAFMQRYDTESYS